MEVAPKKWLLPEPGWGELFFGGSLWVGGQSIQHIGAKLIKNSAPNLRCFFQGGCKIPNNTRQRRKDGKRTKQKF